MSQQIKYEERSYQNDHIEKIVKAAARHRCVCAQLPTGGGKTVEFCKLAHRFYHSTGKSVLILVHREELMYQTQKTMKSIFDEEMPLIKAGTNFVRFAPAFIGMAESVYKRIDRILESEDSLNIGLIIIDEAHNGLYNKHMREFTKEYVIGFTATPKSSSKRDPMNNYYGDIVVGPQIKELIALGNLCQNVTIEPKDVVDRAMLSIASTGDFDVQNMANEYRKAKYVANTLSAYIRFALKKKTVIYNVNVEHSKDVTNLFTMAGFKCKYLDGTTPEHERKEMFKWFKETPDAILCNVGVATMGFDEPTIECIIVNRATTSMPLWLQMCGRGGRPIDEFIISMLQSSYPYQLKKKKKFLIIDMGGNRINHGDWSDDRDWEYIFNNPDISTGDGIAPTKECPQCGCLVHAALVKCNMPLPKPDDEDAECGYIFDRKKFEENEILEEFNFVNSNIDVEALIRFNGKNASYHVFLEIGRKLVDETLEHNVSIDERKEKYLLLKYYELAARWHSVVYPNKYYNKQWHEGLAEKYLKNYLKTVKENYQNA